MTGEQNPFVSVIITTYHNELLLPRAIESVLGQTYQNIELIVVDDNAPDSPSRRKTERVMSRYPSVQYIHHPKNLNGAAARNTGIRAAKGKYLAFLDNDDFYFKSHIAQCVQALQSHPDCDCVLCGVLKICEGLCWDYIPAAVGDLEKVLIFSETALGTGSNLFLTAKAAKQLGGFDVSFQRHQDVEFGLRLFSQYHAVSLNSVQIVKEMGGYSNVPDFSRFLQTKQHLWDTFQETIERLSREEQNRYYASQYSALLYAACKGGQKKDIQWTVKQLEHYRPLSYKERMLVCLSQRKLFGCYEGLKLTVKRCKSPSLLRRVMRELEADDQAMLRQALNKACYEVSSQPSPAAVIDEKNQTKEGYTK